MKVKIGVFLLGLLLLGIFGGLLFFREERSNQAENERNLPPTVGSAVPDFELAGMNETNQTLSSYQGKRVLINFWATWCGPCKEEMPLLERYGKKYAGKLVILGVDSGEKPEVVGAFIAELKITFPILLDQAGIVSDRYFVQDFPYTFFVDENGILRGQHIGLLTEDWLVQYLKTIGLEP